MKKLSKLFATLIVVVLTLTMVSATATSYEVMDNAIYIASADVPEEATEYALDKFSHLSAEFVASMGFTYEEACSMRVASGFYAESCKGTIERSDVYYFPVVVDNKIVALITVTGSNDSYSFQFGADEMATALNDLSTTAQSPVKVMVSQEAYYAVIGDEVILLSSLPYAEQTVIDEQMETIAIESVENEVCNVISISSSNVYDTSLVISGESVQSYVGMIRNVTIVDNERKKYDDGTLHGTCWASCAASMIDYYLNGDGTSDALTIRDDILKDIYDTTSSYAGSLSTMKSYIESYVSGTTMKTTYTISWSDIRTAILTNNAPFCTQWEPPETSTYAAHVMVVCGYYYDPSYPDDSSYYYMKLMDPNNTSSYITIEYGGTHTLNNVEYSWEYTLMKK
ncbi:MAG: hypothetical protein LUE20_05840 [Oscillospiraceae bacterium]|nr:hypothetical protein [Oscillospiraceae bacterium]